MSNIDRWPTGALKDLLEADATLNTLVGGRIFAAGLPKAQAASMPRKAIVMRMNGGPGQDDLLPYGDVRVDFFSYGETFGEAQEVWFHCARVLQNMTPQKLGDVQISNCKLEVGPRQLVDPDGDWPMFFDSWIITAARVAV